ncbi:MAG: ABC transporter substrate-binding protein [Gracilibacteraceae bacterium]|jgi:putative ABC transport system substrate-binding protein|nr:ABC transporter substrate-binding protein [Gracilibacteraceae bacterium]
MKIGKKILTLVIAVFLAAVSFAGCGGGQSQPGGAGAGTETETPAAAAVYKIGVIQLAENGAFTDMREGFLNRLSELGYAEEQLEVDYKNAQGDVGTLNTICQEMARSDKNIVVTIATPAAQAYVSQESEIPLIFISVSDPVSAGIMSDLSAPDRNATGSSNLVPVDEIFQMAATLTPEVKDYGILYNTGEANAVSTVANAKAYLEANGYTFREATVTNSSEVQQAAEALAARAEAIYVPIDSMVQTAMPQVAQIAKDAGLPLYGSSPVMVRDGALATVSTDDTQVGAVAAELADRYFQGTPITEIPAVAISDFIFVINQTTADAIGVTIPAAYADAVIMTNAPETPAEPAAAE